MTLTTLKTHITNLVNKVAGATDYALICLDSSQAPAMCCKTSVTTKPPWLTPMMNMVR